MGKDLVGRRVAKKLLATEEGTLEAGVHTGQERQLLEMEQGAAALTQLEEPVRIDQQGRCC